MGAERQSACISPRLGEVTKYRALFLFVILLMVGVPVSAKLPKQAEQALKNKYLRKQCVVRAASIPARYAESKTEIISVGDRHEPAGQTRRIESKPALVPIREGKVGEKDPRAATEFLSGEEVKVARMKFNKDNIEIVVEDLGQPRDHFRSAQLNFYLEPQLLDSGNVDEIAKHIEVWVKPQ